MGKLTRLGFLVVGVAALVGVTNVLIGCGAGTEKNTPYFGAYGGDWLIQSRVDNSSTRYAPDLSGRYTVSIDEKGHMLGLIRGALGSNYALDGNVNENGGFDGVMRLGSAAYHFTGKMSEQLVTLMTDDEYAGAFGFSRSKIPFAPIPTTPVSRQETSSPSPSPSPSASTATGSGKEGIAGNFKITIDGEEYRGFFQATGGQTTSGG